MAFTDTAFDLLDSNRYDDPPMDDDLPPAAVWAAEQNDFCVRFPATLIDGHLVHVFESDDEWHVWLNTEASEFDGLCIGIGTSRDLAVAQAVHALEAIAEFLQGAAK